jgi:hypothetical protein
MENTHNLFSYLFNYSFKCTSSTVYVVKCWMGRMNEEERWIENDMVYFKTLFQDYITRGLGKGITGPRAWNRTGKPWIRSRNVSDWTPTLGDHPVAASDCTMMLGNHPVLARDCTMMLGDHPVVTSNLKGDVYRSSFVWSQMEVPYFTNLRAKQMLCSEYLMKLNAVATFVVS